MYPSVDQQNEKDAHAKLSHPSDNSQAN